MWLTDISETETRRLSSFHVTLSRETACLSSRGVVFFFHDGGTGHCVCACVTSCAVGMLINTEPVMSAQSRKTEQRINSSRQTAKRYKCGLSFLSSRAAESRGRRQCVVCLSTSAYLSTLTEIPPNLARRAQPSLALQGEQSAY